MARPRGHWDALTACPWPIAPPCAPQPRSLSTPEAESARRSGRPWRTRMWMMAFSIRRATGSHMPPFMPSRALLLRGRLRAFHTLVFRMAL
eukprot:scaffold2878_cov111-Isochrysis_galbana.AAC.6